jgi:short-subunit dehydrogenase
MFFNNKVVWITGASSGIGEALAMAFAREGAKLILSARRVEELERVKQRCPNPHNVFILSFDLEKDNNWNELAASAHQSFGRLDILVNNGGISQRAKAIDTNPEILHKLFAVNFFAQVALTRAVLPYMQQQQSGNIAVISSIAGKFGFYLRSGYAATKHALHGYFESLMLEEEQNKIKVHLICPGKVNTPISLNAVTGNGSVHAKMDISQQQGISPDSCAKQILQAIKKNKKEVLIGGKEIFAVTIKRYFPSLFWKIIKKQNPL